MVLNHIQDALGLNSTPNKTQSSPDPTPETDESSSTSVLSRPPGWDELVGTFEKPVIPIEERRIRDIIEGMDYASQMADFDCLLPPLGVNDEHIQLHLYTVRNTEAEERSLVVDVHISDFGMWLPEDGVTDDGHEWTYPTDALTSCGPYYMELANNLGEVLRINDMKYSLVEYDESEDYAIFSAEIQGYWTEEVPLELTE